MSRKDQCNICTNSSEKTMNTFDSFKNNIYTYSPHINIVGIDHIALHREGRY